MCFPATGAPTAPAAVCQNGVMDSVLHPVEPLAICPDGDGPALNRIARVQISGGNKTDFSAQT